MKLHWLAGRSRRERRLRGASLLAIVTGVLFIVWAALFDPLQFVQRIGEDALLREGRGSNNVAIVAIDNEALEENGRLGEWPRSLHATAVQKLREAGASVIVYDILFVDEGQEDEALIAAIGGAGNVLLPLAGSGSLPAEDSSLYRYEAFVMPLEPLRTAAASLGHANTVADGDGRVRRVPLFVEAVSGEQYPALSLAAFYLHFGRVPPVSLERGVKTLPLFGRNVPLESSGAMRINYVGGAESFNHLAFNDLINGNFDEALVKGKVVFVGQTATGADTHSVPLLGSASGVEIHANTLDTLLRSRFLRSVGNEVGLVTALLFVIVAGLSLPRWRPTYAVLLILAMVLIYLVFSAFMFYQGYILDFMNPPAALVLAMMVALVYRALAERAAQNEVGELFGRYVTAGVAKELMQQADRGELQLGGEMREVSTMFCDIRGFTSLSQQITPHEMVMLLNRQFDVIVSNVLKNGGIVNKFVGDCVMAFWNAPQEQTDHSFLACRCAMDAQAQLEALAGPGPSVRFGFGINTGLALVGNVGTAGRLEYTVIGESVNTASRLCGVADGGEIWVGERTHELINGRIEAEELPPQHLKGMANPVNVFRLKRQATEEREV